MMYDKHKAEDLDTDMEDHILDSVRYFCKVKETLNNLIDWVNELLSHYKSESEEAKTLREYKKELKKVSKMWDEMLVSAIESNQALQKEGITGEALAKAEGKADVGEVQYASRIDKKKEIAV